MSYFWFEVRYLLCAGATLPLLLQFPGAIWLQNRVNDAEKWSPEWFLFGVPLFIFGLQDVVYNVIFGTAMFLERPRELLFTTRLKRLDDAGHLPECLARFKRTLNEIDPGHV